MIEVRHVTKTYGKKNTAFRALSDVSFTIPDGTSVAIVGKSGSGKSTLMHAMSGLDRPEKGEVVVDGENILALKQKQIDLFRAKKIGFIFQSFFVQGNESTRDNISLPLEIANVAPRQRLKRIAAALESVGLSDKIKNKAKDLSGGQKQRLAIARAIVNRPRIIFADEPTGNLDTKTSEKIEKLLFSYHQDNEATLIIVTHDIELAAKCQMQIIVKDGRVTAVHHSRENPPTDTVTR